MDATLELQQIRQNLSRMKILTCILVGILPCVLLKDGVDAAEFLPTPESGACGGGGAAEERESCREPLLGSEFVGQPLSESAKELRPVVLRSSAEILAHVRDPHFDQHLERDPNLRDKVVRFFELQDRYFYELYGVHRSDSALTHFFHAARRGTLRSELDKREVRALMVMYLEVAAGDMGGDTLFWNESERRQGRRTFSKTLALFRRLVGQEQLLEFLRSRANQYLFFIFYLILLRMLADRMSSRLPFDQYVTDRLRLGHLASELTDEQGRVKMVEMLRVGNSVLTESPSSILLARLEPSAPPAPSAPLEPSAPLAPSAPPEPSAPAEPSAPPKPSRARVFHTLPVSYTPPVPSASPEPSAPFPSYVEPELYGRPAPYAPQVTSAGLQSEPGQAHSARPEEHPVHVPSPRPQQQLLQVPSVPTQPQPLQVPSASPQPQPDQASSGVAQPHPKEASSAAPGLFGGPESAVPPVAPAAPRSASSLLRGLSCLRIRAKSTKHLPENT